MENAKWSINNFESSKNRVLCSDHFHSDCFERDLQSELLPKETFPQRKKRHENHKYYKTHLSFFPSHYSLLKTNHCFQTFYDVFKILKTLLFNKKNLFNQKQIKMCTAFYFISLFFVQWCNEKTKGVRYVTFSVTMATEGKFQTAIILYRKN